MAQQQPVKLDLNLLNEAREMGEIMNRSMAGQIEYWARLGRALDRVIGADQAARLLARGQSRPLSEAFAEIDTAEGRARVKAQLEARPFPHYDEIPGEPDKLVKVDEDGTRTIGRIVGRKFEPI